jgi:basic amino acid/polyamine antiporter, APA family
LADTLQKPVRFVREATGLVREFSAFDAFMIGTAVVLPGIFGYSSVIGFISGADPGANFVLSALFGFAIMAPLGFIYILIAGVLPRSGGDYVWISRTLHPILGFLTGWGLWISIVAIVGLDGYLTGTLIIPISLVSFGSITSNPSLLNAAASAGTPTGAFLIGLLMIGVSSLIILPGPKAFSRIQTVLFAIIMIGTVVSFGILLTSSHQQFVNSLTGFAGTNITYNGVISLAQANSWSFVPVALTPTLTSIPLSVLVYNGFNYSAAASGEVKNVKKSMLIGIFGSLVFSMIVTIIGVTLSLNILGYNFIQASFFLGGKFPLPAPPWMPLFLTALNSNGLVVTLVQAAWIISIFWNTAAFLLVATRYVFAFSFDRVLPMRLADVNERFHFPLKASVLNFVVAAVFLGIASFTPWLGLYLNSVTIWSILWIVVSVVAIVLPFRKKDLVSSLPGGRWKLPLLSIVGIIALPLMIANFYWSVTTPAIGPSTVQADAILAVIFVTGIITYLVSNSYHKAHGVDLKAIYSEIPPE